MSRAENAMNISGYRIEEKIGSGGMAIVYRAIQESLGRRVALKVMNPLYSDSEEFSRRFLEEARLLASIVHTHIITIHDFGISDGFHFISMEYVEGGDLGRRIRAGIAAPQAVAYMETVAECLSVAHDNHIVHRDIKPANILFRKDGTLLLTDFGIAKQLNASKGLTSTGSMVGSPHYISPEQAQAKPVDGRADIYSLGILFYEMLVGERPFAGDSDVDIAIKQISQPLPELPEDLADFRGLIDRMTRKKPDERFPNCTSLLDAVRELRTTGGWSGDVHGGPIPEIAEAGIEPAASDDTPKTVKLPAAGGDTVPLEQGVTVPDREASKRFGWRWYLSGLAACLVLVLMGGVLFIDRLIDAVLPPAEPERIAAERPPAESAQPASTAVRDSERQLEPERIERRRSEPERIASANAEEERSEIARAEAEALERARLQQEKLDKERLERERLARLERERIARLQRERLAEERQRQAKIRQLLRNAEVALQAFRLTTPVENSAYTYYKQVLAIDPGNKAAQHGIDGIAESYYDLALGAERRWAYKKAIGYADTGLSVRPNHPGLRQLRNRLTSDEGTAGRAFKETFKDVKALFD